MPSIHHPMTISPFRRALVWREHNPARQDLQPFPIPLQEIGFERPA